jgi:serine/threonine-protein kinase
VPHQPPDNLIELLERLSLATRQQVEEAAWRVRRLAGELPLFESVWVDALSQARVLTPFQAAEINAGRGEGLRLGPYVMQRGLASNGLGHWFVARHVGNGALVRLMRAGCELGQVRVIGQLQALIQDLQGLEHPGLLPPIEAGAAAGDIWIACKHVEGVCAADWLAHHGRLPPLAVLEIARQTAAALAALEPRGRLHSDLGARQLVLTRAGQAVLALPGVRAILRPAEGYTRLDLLPEGYDYLAPERIAGGTPPDTASEAFACGCLWWHLLCGRPPLSGGDALGKVRSAQQARIADVMRFAPETPPLLAEAIRACTQSDPRRRPRSMIELAAQLGPPDKTGRAAVVQSLQPIASTIAGRRRKGRAPLPAASDGSLFSTAVAALLIAGLGVWWLGNRETKLPLNSIGGSVTEADVAGQATTPAVGQAPTSPHADELVLSGDRVQLERFHLRPAQTIRSAPGKRALVLVPPGGFVVESEDLRFENLDFAPSVRPTERDGPSALIRLRAERATFIGCSFQAAEALRHLITAIEWQGSTASAAPDTWQSGRLQLEDCLFGRVAAGVSVGRVGAIRLAMTNCLHLGPGPWIRLAEAPARDEPCLIALSHCTLRGARALLELSFDAAEGDRAGEFHIQADDCAFSPATPGGLVIAASPNGQTLLRRLRFSGQGSILSLEAPLALWQTSDGAHRQLPDDEIEATGLVRSRMVFAGEDVSQPVASRVVRWQAPLASPDAPGILERPLFVAP